MSTTAFVKQIELSLVHWQKQANGVTDLTLQTAISDVDSLITSVQVGIQCAETREQAIALILSLHRYIAIMGHWQVWIQLVRGVLGYSLSDRVHIKLLNELGFILLRNESYADALNVGKHAVSLAIEKNHLDLIALTQSYLCLIYMETSNYSDAYQLGIAIIKQMPEGSTEKASLLNTTGLSAFWLGKNEEAIRYFEEAVPIWEDCAAHIYLGRTFMNWGNALFAQKNIELSLNKHDKAYNFFEMHNSYSDMAYLILNKGVNHAQIGEMKAAQILLTDALKIVRESNCRLQLTGLVLMNIGGVFSLQKEHDRARGLLYEALEIWEKLDDEVKYANTLIELGKTVEKKQAYDLWQEASKILAQQPQENVFVQQCVGELSDLLA